MTARNIDSLDIKQKNLPNEAIRVNHVDEILIGDWFHLEQMDKDGRTVYIGLGNAQINVFLDEAGKVQRVTFDSNEPEGGNSDEG